MSSFHAGIHVALLRNCEESWLEELLKCTCACLFQHDAYCSASDDLASAQLRMELVRLAQSSKRQRRQHKGRGKVTRFADGRSRSPSTDSNAMNVDGSDTAGTAAAAVSIGLSSAAASAARSQRRLLNLEAAIRVAEQIQEAEQQQRQQQEQQEQQQQPTGDNIGWTEHHAQQEGRSSGRCGRVNASQPSQHEEVRPQEMTDVLLNLLEELSLTF